MSATPWLMVTGLFGVGSEDSASMNLSYFRRAPLKGTHPSLFRGPRVCELILSGKLVRIPDAVRSQVVSPPVFLFYIHQVSLAVCQSPHLSPSSSTLLSPRVLGSALKSRSHFK